MMLIKHEQSIKSTSTPLCFSSYENEIYLIDSAYVFYRISKKNLKILNSKKITSKHEPHHNLYRGFSASEHYMAITFPGQCSITLLDVNNGIKSLGTVKWHELQISVSAISTRNGFFVSGGQDGKVYIYDLETVNMIGTFPQKSDYISDISISDYKNFVAVSSFNKSVSIYDIDKNIEIGGFNIEDVVQNTLFFDEDNFLFAVCRGGKGGIYNIKTKELVCSESFFSDWPTAMIASKDKRHALIGTRDGYLHAINLKYNFERFKIKVRETGISKLHLEDDYLFIAYTDGVTELYDVNYGEENIKKHIEEQNYDQAREELNINAMLYLHPVIELFDQAWASAMSTIKNALIDSNLELANNIAAPFLFDKNKKTEFQTLLVDLEHVAEFKEAYEAENYTHAYELVEKEPVLKQFPMYEEMEAKWEKILSTIKTLLQHDPLENKYKCNVLIKPFVGVPEKRKIAKEIIENSKIFVEAENAIAAKDFKEYYRLVGARAFLKDTPMYKKIEKLSMRIMEKVNEYLKDGKYSDVLKLAKGSLNMLPIQKQLNDAIAEVSNRLNFFVAIKDNDLTSIYKILDQHDEFFYLKEFAVIDAGFKELVKKAMEYALIGNSEDVHEMLNFYFNTKCRVDKVAQIMKISYLNEIKENEDNEKVNWLLTFKTYCDLFSKDAEITRVANEINKADNIANLIHNDEDEFGYREKEMPNSIIH